jgi:hypothetical protein
MKIKLSTCLLVFLLAFILGCSSCEKQDMGDPKYKAEIEAFTGLDFPKSTKWIKYRLNKGLDEDFIASFTLPKEEIEKLFEKVEFEWSNSVRHVRNTEGVKWFNPDSIKKFKAFETRYPTSNTVLRVIYDDSNETDTKQEVLLYLEWFSLW